LLWVYYSVQIFLFGAEFTKIFANRHGSKQANPVGSAGDEAPSETITAAHRS
jgi:membrane protein